MNKARAKKKLLRELAYYLRENGDNLFPDDIAEGSKEYLAFERARDELVEECDRRGGEEDEEEAQATLDEQKA
jgi:hypothetical protein